MIDTGAAKVVNIASGRDRPYLSETLTSQTQGACVISALRTDHQHIKLDLSPSLLPFLIPILSIINSKLSSRSHTPLRTCRLVRSACIDHKVYQADIRHSSTTSLRSVRWSTAVRAKERTVRGSYTSQVSCSATSHITRGTFVI